jgi:hypothetical protein
MAVDPRRFDQIERVVKNTSRQLDDSTSTLASRLASHTHSYVPLSTVTAKGDLLVATASGTIVNQAVGSDGQVFVADSTQTDGVKWFSPPVFSGTNTTALTVGTGFTVIPLGSESFDSANGHSTVTNTSRYTIQVAGYYSICGFINKDLNWTTGLWASVIYKNGVIIPGAAQFIQGSAGLRQATPTRLLSLAVNDYIELVNYQDTGINQSLILINGVSAGLDVWYVRGP